MVDEDVRVWIGTSWKMNKIIAEAVDYARRLAAVLPVAGVQAFVLPPHTALDSVRDCLPQRSELLLGAQNAHWACEGAGTGEISMRMVADAGAQLVEIGHSERREEHGETDETVAKKARAAIDQGLSPLICVGETASVRAAGGSDRFVTDQLVAAVSLLAPHEIELVLVGYEPVWAIGSTGTPASPEDIAPVMAALTHKLRQISESGRCRALLYGGGVDCHNAPALLRDPNTQGLFVGRAAWNVAGFIELVEIGRREAARLRM